MHYTLLLKIDLNWVIWNNKLKIYAGIFTYIDSSHELLNCITIQALSNVSTKGAVDISKGLRSVSSFATEISDKIASPSGAINRTINKAAFEVNRAERIMSKSNIF